MKTRVSFLIIISALLLSATLLSHESSCIQELKDVFRNMSGSKTAQDDRVYYLEYKVKTVMRNKSIPGNEILLKVYAGKNNYYLNSKQVEVYQDKKNTFTIMPLQKIIYWADVSDSSTAIDPQDIFALRAQMLDSCRVVYCNPVKSPDGRYNKEIALEPAGSFKTILEYSRIIFWIRSDKNLLHKILLSYPNTSRTESVEMTFITMNENYRGMTFHSNIRSKFVDSNDRLLTRYQSYQLVDLRKKK